MKKEIISIRERFYLLERDYLDKIERLSLWRREIISIRERDYLY